MSSEDSDQVSSPEVPYVNGEEAGQFVAESERPTLLEFCVPVGCFRCDQMRASINDFAQSKADRLTVRRVNLNVERQLASQWGVTVCPTYIMVNEGLEVGRSQFPTSADLISAMIPHESVTD